MDDVYWIRHLLRDALILPDSPPQTTQWEEEKPCEGECLIWDKGTCPGTCARHKAWLRAKPSK